MGDALCRPPGSPGVPLTGLASEPVRGLWQTSRGLLERLGPSESQQCRGLRVPSGPPHRPAVLNTPLPALNGEKTLEL